MQSCDWWGGRNGVVSQIEMRVSGDYAIRYYDILCNHTYENYDVRSM
jgi:hypothetical protein